MPITKLTGKKTYFRKLLSNTEKCLVDSYNELVTLFNILYFFSGLSRSKWSIPPEKSVFFSLSKNC